MAYVRSSRHFLVEATDELSRVALTKLLQLKGVERTRRRSLEVLLQHIGQEAPRLPGAARAITG